MMEVQVMMPPSPAVDFNYDSASTSPYATAPSSPQFTIPFTWEEKPGIPKQNNDHNCEDEEEDEQVENDTDFAFGYLERHSISAADELFDCGKIKPLKPPPRLHFSNESPRSPKSPKSPKLRFKEALSPRSKKKDFDPFSEALKQTSGEQTQPDQNQRYRGREGTMETTTRCKVSRSLSPFRVSELVNSQKSSTDQIQSSPWYNKWNLKNLLLFRSASEGSVTSRKDSSKKYTMLKKSSDHHETKTFSFRSTDSGGSMKVSADEMNFTAEEVLRRRKTAVPYKLGLMGCLRFNQNAGSVHHEISRGINSVIKQ